VQLRGVKRAISSLGLSIELESGAPLGYNIYILHHHNIIIFTSPQTVTTHLAAPSKCIYSSEKKMQYNNNIMLYIHV
jgi:hypothetical protein